MAEVTRTLYPKRMRNKEIEESIKLAMAQFREERPDLNRKADVSSPYPLVRQAA